MKNPHASPQPDIFLRPAEADDLLALVDISRETFIDTYESQNDPIPFWDYVEKAFTEDSLLAELRAPNTQFFLAYYEGALAGYVKLNLFKQAPGLPPEAPQLEVQRIYVQKLYKGLGLGYVLLQQAIQTGREHGCQYLWLGAWQKNTPAIAWYFRQGFEIFGSEVFMMGEEAQEDWLLYKKI